MTQHRILTYPDKRLRVKTKPIVDFGKPLHVLVDDMFETMYAAQGVGLAATQIGLDIMLAVIDVVGKGDAADQLVLVNPEITERRGKEVMHEGCLSIPGVYDKVPRATWVSYKAQNVDGKSYTVEGDGLLAECIQHEIDHLHGRLYIDLLPAFKRDRVKKKLKILNRKKDK